MEIRAFAEQVLFAVSLEEKLRPAPASLTDEQPGPAMLAPPAPGRPQNLHFKPRDTAPAEFPSVRKLENARERGRLLHFFANHELLATELMALVLLRFPDAPPAFRRGVLRTLQDEQLHTRLYIERMHATGIEFGEQAVSGYFWNAVSGMQNPMDYVAGLSLTFEQANLDFARHFSRGFATVGDTETAALLDRIYHDEIAHVAYGLKWFRRWKNPDESDWDAFCRQLKFPLSPQRAKGFSLNVEGRRAAGLDASFIAQLDVFARSKGRTPNVHVFNPLAETQLARGTAFTPAKPQRQLVEDLAALPQFVCRQDDIVLVSRRPAVEHLAELKRAGFALPEFVEIPTGAIAADHPLTQRKLAHLRPWAWAPDSIAVLGALSGNTATPQSLPHFTEAFARLYSKAWSADVLRDFLAMREPGAWLCGIECVGTETHSADETLDAVATIRARGHHRIVLKHAYGLAGQNALRLWEPAITTAQTSWIEQAFANGATLVVEPWLERVSDFSAQFEMHERGLKLVGFPGLLNDLRGQFVANDATRGHERRPPREVIASFGDDAPRDLSQRIATLYEDVRAALEPALRATGHRGPLGIDAFTFRDASGAVRLKPIVEINPRYTMGRLTLELMAHTRPGSAGRFRILNRAALRRDGAADFEAWSRAMRERYPVALEGEPIARLRSGVVCLNDPVTAQVCLAVFEVARTAGELPPLISRP